MKTPMMTRAMRPLIALVGVALASSVAATTINTSWRVHGDGAARPVQVFDDGSNIYVQVRDTSSAPAPVGPGGPIDFTMRGHYLVLPMMESFRLHLGASVVDVVSGQGAPTRRLPPGVVSITSPVEAKELPPLPAPVASAPRQPAPAPRATSGYVPTRVVATPPPALAVPAASPIASAPAASAPARSDGVLGDIVVGGRPAVESSRGTSVARLSNASVTSDIERALTAIPVGTRIRVRADGTVAGATAARRVQDQCVRLSRECEMAFRGAPAGRIHLETE